MQSSPEFAAAIERHRVRAGISGAELAFRAGIEASYISKIQRHAYVPSRRVTTRVLRALGLSPAEEARLLLLVGYAPPQDSAWVTKLSPQAVDAVRELASLPPDQQAAASTLIQAAVRRASRRSA